MGEDPFAKEPKGEQKDAGLDREPEGIYAEIAELASKARKVSDEDFASAGGWEVIYNNFSLVFLGLKQKESGLPPSFIAGSYLARAEQLGDNWKRFLEENRYLIGNINFALEQMDIYDQLNRKIMGFYEKGLPDM